MKSRFIQQLTKYYRILEQDVGQATPQVAPQDTQQVTPEAQPNQPQPAASPKSSVRYAVLSQLVLDAFKTTQIRYKDDIKYSDNIIRTPHEATKYQEIIKRNLAPDLQKKLQSNVGKSDQENDLDSADMMKLTQLALQALFFVSKDVDSTEFNDIASTDKITVDNARQVTEKIRNFVSER